MELTPEIQQYIFEATYAPCMEKRQPNKEREIVIGTILEHLHRLDLIYHDGKGLLYLISLIVTLLVEVPECIICRFNNYYSKPLFKPEEAYRLGNFRVENTDSCIKLREKYGSLKNQYNVDNKAEDLKAVRKYLYINGLRLEGTIKNSYITFGKEADSLLRKVIPNYSKIKSGDIIENKLKELYQEDINVIIR